MFTGWGLLVSHKALEDWSANQPAETIRVHGDKDKDEEEGNRPFNWDNRSVSREADI